MSNYEKLPAKKINGKAFCGYQQISEEIQKNIKSPNFTVVVECYPGSNIKEIEEGLAFLKPNNIIHSNDAFLPDAQYSQMLKDILTDDRVFGVMTTKYLCDCFDSKKLSELKQYSASLNGITLIIGIGASLISSGDILIVADMARWEIQLRYRNGMSNMNTENSDAPILSKYKQGFFFDWRVADKQKKQLFSTMDYIMETNKPANPTMISRETFNKAMDTFSHEPFRTVPYFDPGVWGGQWMKNVCGLDKSKANFAWSFDGVPEENSILLDFGSCIMELPAMDLTLTKPRSLLGERVHARFGAEFPIRFDFLDTVGGQNLSLQVHPLTEYIQEKFNMRYTQDESYYILDASKDSHVYLGVKTGINKAEMINALKDAQAGGKPFEADKYINRIPVKKHDHVLIPAGTIHCSGKDTMVLEISATPYIFTFKLWDWGRLGTDGLPRPIHIEHGEKNICFDRNTEWVNNNLIHMEKTISQTDSVKIEETGLHEREFIKTTRYTCKDAVTVSTNGSVNVLNLIEGNSAVIESLNREFEPFTVHYAETFIVPACVNEYKIIPTDGTVMVIKAEVR